MGEVQHLREKIMGVPNSVDIIINMLLSFVTWNEPNLLKKSQKEKYATDHSSLACKENTFSSHL